MRGRRQAWRSLCAGGVLMVVLALLAAELPAAGGREDSAMTEERHAAHDSVHAIILPDLTPDLPDGPHRQQFEALCRLCHSPRLVLTQPRLSEKKWAEVVHKMTTVYRAPIQPQQEQEIVSYLVSIHGSEH